MPEGDRLMTKKWLTMTAAAMMLTTLAPLSVFAEDSKGDYDKDEVKQNDLIEKTTDLTIEFEKDSDQGGPETGQYKGRNTIVMAPKKMDFGKQIAPLNSQWKTYQVQRTAENATEPLRLVTLIDQDDNAGKSNGWALNASYSGMKTAGETPEYLNSYFAFRMSKLQSYDPGTIHGGDDFTPPVPSDANLKNFTGKNVHVPNFKEAEFVKLTPGETQIVMAGDKASDLGGYATTVDDARIVVGKDKEPTAGNVYNGQVKWALSNGYTSGLVTPVELINNYGEATPGTDTSTEG